jgi:hypothetical protein
MICSFNFSELDSPELAAENLPKVRHFRMLFSGKPRDVRTGNLLEPGRT